MRLAVLFLLLSLGLPAADPSPRSATIRALDDVALDPEACYRVRDLVISRPDVRFYLTDGYLIFSQSVDGHRHSALFTADVEGGDAEMLVIPPTRIERKALAARINSATLDEHFRTAAFVFGAAEASRLISDLVAARGPLQPDREKGAELAARYSPTIRNLQSGLLVRLLEEEFNLSDPGILLATVAGDKLGVVECLYEPRWAESLVVGLSTERDGRPAFDTWTQFRPRGLPPPSRDTGLRTESVDLDATLDPALTLTVLSRIRLVTERRPLAAIPFVMSRVMRVKAVRVNGQPAEFFQRAGGALIRSAQEEEDTFLVFPAEPIKPGEQPTVEIEASGTAVDQTTTNVYFVHARSSWYPHVAIDLAPHHVVFRYPRNLTLSLPGEQVSLKEEGDAVVAEHRITERVRLVGFNLGRFERLTEKRGDLTVDLLYSPSSDLQFATSRALLSPTIGRRPSTAGNVSSEIVKPVSRAPEVAQELADSFAYLSGLLGPPVLKHLRASPIPGGFGQGFPGLIYLASSVFVQTPRYNAQSGSDLPPMLYSDLLAAHEVGHQWWGNLIYTTERGDEWLMESLANYSSLLYLEHRYGRASLERILSDYRTHLLAKNPDKSTVESAGPIIWGLRLEQTKTAGAWQTITYEKGTWILHMLRGRLGRDRFLQMLAAVRKRYQFASITVAEFRATAASFLPPGDPDPQLQAFFAHWVYDTGIPHVKLRSQLSRVNPREAKITLTLEDQQDYNVFVPVEAKLVNGATVRRWVQTSADPVEETLSFAAPIKSIALDPGQSMLLIRE